MHLQKNQHFVRRVRFAAAGLGAAWRFEHSFRYQCAALACVLIVSIKMRLEPMWWALVTLTCCAVIAAELFNTALEHLADHLHPELHPRIRIVKDCAAAAVLVASIGALGVGAALTVHLLQRP